MILSYHWRIQSKYQMILLKSSKEKVLNRIKEKWIETALMWISLWISKLLRPLNQRHQKRLKIYQQRKLPLNSLKGLKVKSLLMWSRQLLPLLITFRNSILWRRRTIWIRFNKYQEVSAILNTLMNKQSNNFY